MSRWIRIERLAIALLGIAVAYLLVSQIITRADANEQAGRKSVAEQQAAAAAQDARRVADPLADLCAQDPTVRARAGEGCRAAEEVRDTPPNVAAPSSDAIEQAVETYLRANPPAGGRPTLDQVTAAVAGYLSANPPQPGRAPTAGEIRAAVSEYIAVNPPAPGAAGQNGVNGKNGRPPTDAEIDAAVQRYLQANPPAPGPRGEVGPRGEPGRGVSSVRVESCHLLVTYTDGVTEDVGNTCGTAPPDDGGLLPIPTEDP